MKQRIITGLIIGVVVVGVFLLRLLSPYIFDIAVCAMIIVASNEVARVYNRSGHANDSTLITFYPILCFVATFLAYTFNLKIYHIILINIGLILLLMLVEMIICLFIKKKVIAEKDDKNFKYSTYLLKRTILTGFLMLYPSFILSPLFIFNHLANFSYLTMPQPNIDFSLFFMILFILTTVATDTFAYFIGRSLKGPKLCPYISPNKTISGAIGGVVGAVIIGFAVYGAFCAVGLDVSIIQPYIIVIYTIIASIISQLGDIFASIIKRRARTKDYSSIFPGHGGFMDRLDGISFNCIFSLAFFMLFIL